MDIVRRKTWPETSWPFLSLGLTRNEPAALNKFGCVCEEMVARARHRSLDTETCSPEGIVAMHSPPE